MTVVLLSCIQVNDVHVFQCLTFSDKGERISHRNVTGPNKKKKTQKNEKGKKELELTEIFSVLFCS